MAKGHGKDQYLAIEDSASITLRDISPFIDSVDFDRQVDLAESTTVGAEDKVYIPGLSGAGLEIAGKYDDTATVGPTLLYGDLAAKVLVGFEFGPLGNLPGKPKYSGNGFVERFRVSAPLEGVIKFSATFRVDGPVTSGAF